MNPRVLTQHIIVSNQASAMGNANITIASQIVLSALGDENCLIAL